MKYKLVLIIGFISLIFSCENSKQLVNINAENRIIAEELPSNKDIEAVIDPYKINLDKSMTKILSYSTDTYSKNDGNYNTAIGNLMADAIMELSNPIFKSRTGKNLDMVLLNHGGIRSVLSKGNITTRTAYSLMPFENSVIVVALKGTVIMEMTSYLKEFGKPHPISGLELVLNSDNTYNTILIGGEPVEMEKTYHVATNDYLYKGGDQMYFLKKSDTLYDLNYKIRTVLIDYFKTYDTLSPTKDQRFIKLKN
ncbi:MAG: 5'-nucleotidase [Flavobacteriaceae bacterium]|jgi:2',3'-cyclic-nucleotide 2'-phosphodiesterase (5'-nucleotidase family)|nr:5'-nucleotidase [Flavobacteriaceae bacterium]MDG1793954.1 5'-nucleotidase [Flavobacteriaceae bacterium]